MAALALLLPMEAGVPIPLPADLVMFSVGERVAAGTFPLWLAVFGFEVISVLGTTALFLACRGPASGHRSIRAASWGSPGRGSAAAPVGRDGRPARACGRTRDAGAADAHRSGGGRLRADKGRALPALILGSSVSLQLHLVLGLLLGPLADRAFDRAKGPPVGLLTIMVLGALCSGGPGGEGGTPKPGRRRLPGMHRLEPALRAERRPPRSSAP